MLYNCDNPILKIVAVERMSLTNNILSVAPRVYSALSFRIDGVGRFICGDKAYNVASKEMLYLPQLLPYETECISSEMLVFHFITARNDPEPEIYSLASTADIRDMFLRSYNIWQEKEPGYEAHAMSMLYMILGTICDRTLKSYLPAHFMDAIAYINTHYTDSSISIRNICADFGIGETSFRQLFRETYRKTPVEYITELRLECARRLIASGMRIEEAAYRSGFNDAKYFSRVVKKKYACNPRDLKLYGR